MSAVDSFIGQHVVLSENIYVLDTEQKVSFMGRKKTTQAKERYCELIKFDNQRQLHIRVYKIKANNKRVSWLELEVGKVISADQGGHYSFYFSKVPQYRFFFVDRVRRDEWVHQMNLKDEEESELHHSQERIQRYDTVLGEFQDSETHNKQRSIPIPPRHIDDDHSFVEDVELRKVDDHDTEVDTERGTVREMDFDDKATDTSSRYLKNRNALQSFWLDSEDISSSTKERIHDEQRRREDINSSGRRDQSSDRQGTRDTPGRRGERLGDRDIHRERIGDVEIDRKRYRDKDYVNNSGEPLEYREDRRDKQYSRSRSPPQQREHHYDDRRGRNPSPAPTNISNPDDSSTLIDQLDQASLSELSSFHAPKYDRSPARAALLEESSEKTNEDKRPISSPRRPPIPQSHEPLQHDDVSVSESSSMAPRGGSRHHNHGIAPMLGQIGESHRPQRKEKPLNTPETNNLFLPQPISLLPQAKVENSNRQSVSPTDSSTRQRHQSPPSNQSNRTYRSRDRDSGDASLNRKYPSPTVKLAELNNRDHKAIKLTDLMTNPTTDGFPTEEKFEDSQGPTGRTQNPVLRSPDHLKAKQLQQHHYQTIMAAQTESSILHKEIQALTAMNEELNNALENLEEKHREEIDFAYQEIATLRNLLDSSTQEKQKLLDECADPLQVRRELNHLKDDQESILQMLQDMQRKLSEKEQQNQDLQHLYEESLSTNEALKESVHQMNNELEKKESAYKELSNQFSLTSNSLGDNLQELSQRESLLMQSTNQIMDLKRELSASQSQLQQVQLMIQDYEVVKAKCKGQEERIDLLEKELHHSKLDFIAAKASEESHKLTVTRLESLVNEQQQFVTELNQRLAANEDFKIKFTDISMQMLIVQDEFSRCKIERDGQEREVTRLKALMESIEEDRKIRIKDHESHLLEKAMEIEKLRNQLNKGYADADSLQSEISILQRRIEMQKEETAKARNEEQQLQRRLAVESQGYSNQIQAMKQSLDVAQKANNDLMTRLQTTEEELRLRNRDLEGKVKELQELNDHLKLANQDMTTRLFNLEGQITNLQQSVQTEKQNNKTLQESLQRKEDSWLNEKKVLQSKVIECQDKYEQLKLWTCEKESQVRDGEFTLRDLQDNMASTIAEYSSKVTMLQNSNNRFKDDYDRITNERKVEKKAYEDTIHSHKQFQETLQDRINELERSLASFESDKLVEAAEFNKIIHGLEELSMMQQRQLSDLTAALQREKDLHIQEVTKSKTFQHRLEELEHRLLEESTTKSQLSNELLEVTSNSKERIHILEQDVKKKTSDLYQLNRQYEELEKSSKDQQLKSKQRIDALEENLLQTSKSWKDCQQKLETLDLNLTEKLTETHSTSLILQKNDYLIQDLTRQLKGAMDQSHLYQKELTQCQQQVIELESKYKTSDAEFQQMKVLNNDLHQQKISLQQENHQFHQEITQSKKKIIELERELSSSKIAIASLEKEIDRLDHDLSEAKNDLDDEKHKVSSLNNQLKRAEEHHSELVRSTKKAHEDQQGVLRLRITTLEEELQDAENQVKYYETQLLMTRQEVQKLEEKNKELTQKNSLLRIQVSDMIAKDQLEVERQRMDHQITEVNDRYSNVCNQKNQLNTQLIHIEKQRQLYYGYLMRIHKVLVDTNIGSSSSGSSPSPQNRDMGFLFVDEPMPLSKSPELSPMVITEIELNINRMKEDNDKYAMFCTALQSILSSSTVASGSENNQLRLQTNHSSRIRGGSASNSPAGRGTLAMSPRAPTTPFSPKQFNSTASSTKMNDSSVPENMFEFIVKLRNDIRQCNVQLSFSNSVIVLSDVQQALSSYLETIMKSSKRVQEAYEAIENQKVLSNDEIQSLHDQISKAEQAIQQLKQQRLHQEEKHKAEIQELQREIKEHIQNLQEVNHSHHEQLLQQQEETMKKLQLQKIDLENLSTERNAELLRTVAEKNQELELLESQYKESELNREKLRRTVDDKSNQIRLLQEEVDSLREKIRSKVQELNDTSAQLQDIELQLAKESRQRQETDRALKKQIVKNQEAEASLIANSFRKTAHAPSEVDQSSSFLNQSAISNGPTNNSAVGIGNVSSLGIMRSLSAQRSRPGSSISKEPGLNQHAGAPLLAANTLKKSISQPVSNRTPSGNSSAPPLISDDTRRTVQELLRIQKGTYHHANDGASTRPSTNRGNNKSYFEDDNANNLSNISIVSNNSLYSNSNASFSRRNNPPSHQLGEDHRFNLKDLA